MSENLPDPDAAPVEPTAGSDASDHRPADDPAVVDGIELAPLTAAEETVPAFEVPAPPTFDSGVKDVPAAALDAQPVIPPPPVFGGVADAIAEAAPPRTRRAASQWDSGSDAPPERRVPATASPASAPAVWHVDMDPASAPGTAQPDTYRGWTIGIFGGLAVLLIAAVGFMIFLGASG